MTVVNYVKGQLDSYRDTKRWKEFAYPIKRFELEHRLIGYKGITYTEIVTGGGQQISESLRRSKIIDEINVLERRLKYANKVIEFCDAHFEMVKCEYKQVMNMYFKDNCAVHRIAKATGYSERRIYEIINEETERLSNL